MIRDTFMHSRSCWNILVSDFILKDDRIKLLKEFKEGNINILICSDIVARGIDLPIVNNVIKPMINL